MRIQRLKNEKTRVIAQCKAAGCPWKIHALPASADDPTFWVKTYEPNHTCQREDVLDGVSYQWAAEQFVPLLRENPDTPNDELRDELKRHNVVANYITIYRAKRRALKLIVDEVKPGKQRSKKVKRKESKKIKSTKTVPMLKTRSRKHFKKGVRCSYCMEYGKHLHIITVKPPLILTH